MSFLKKKISLWKPASLLLDSCIRIFCRKIKHGSRYRGQYFLPVVDDLAIPVSQFETLNLPIKKILVVENKTTLYTTLTLPKMDKAIAVFGQGNAVLNIKNTTWLFEKEILYWGDIDVQGFEILSRLREHFTHVKSALMDIVTFETFFENDKGIPTNISTKLNLTEREQELYNILKTNNWRLEQEKLPFDYVTEYFKSD